MLTVLACVVLIRWMPAEAAWKLLRCVLATIILLFVGCSQIGKLPQTTLSIPSIPLSPQTRLANPIGVNTQDSEFLWNQIVDTVEDYFTRIKSEQRPTRDEYQWLEGKLETYPEIGATYFEPWRKDALEGYQRWQSTLQTMRRTAIIRTIPTNEGFAVSVESHQRTRGR